MPNDVEDDEWMDFRTVERVCACGFVGMVDVVECLVDNTAIWVCPECGEEWEEDVSSPNE